MEEDRISLPDDTLEQMLFSEIVKNDGFAGQISTIYRDSWFQTDPQMRVLGKIVLALKEKKIHPTVDLVQACLKKAAERGGREVDIQKCMSAFVSATSFDLGGMDDETRLGMIGEFVKKRMLQSAIMDSLDLIKSGNSEGVAAKCVDMLERANLRLTRSGEGLTFNKSAEDDLESEEHLRLERHNDFISNPESRLPTGWPTLDHLMGGGLLRDGKSLYIVMGTAGQGKTRMLANMAFNFLCQNLKVIIFSMEMSEDAYGRRFDELVSDINFEALGRDHSILEKRRNEFFKLHPNADLHIKEYPPKGASANDFAEYMEKKMQRGGWKPDVIIVDYLGIVADARPSKESNMYQEGLHVSEQLRKLSYAFNVPVITAVQGNTSAMQKGKDAGLDSVADSRGITHTADFIVSTFDDPENLGITCCTILKTRFGERTSFIFKRKPMSSRLYDQGDDIGDDALDTSMSSEEVDILDSLSTYSMAKYR